MEEVECPFRRKPLLHLILKATLSRFEHHAPGRALPTPPPHPRPQCAAELAGHSGAYLQDCRLSAPARRAEDDALAEDLWAKSEELVQAALQKASLDP